ncbi:MAG: glycosyltransferase family 39 protein [Chloroflexi bacterium]|nr:glycosyltransferase family 39 protein [Chloroflexota bacterium]
MPLVWLMGVFLLFYAVQKPVPAGQALAVVRTGLDLAAALFIFVLGAALGRRLLARFPFQTEGERWLFGVGVGLAALSIATLVLGLAGGFSHLTLSAMAALLSLLMLPALYSALRAAATILRSLRPPLPLRLYFAISLALSLLLALAPPSTAFDALLYHLAGPKLYLEAGRIYAIDNPPLYFPSLVEMLFGLAMAIRGDIAAQLLHYGYGTLSAGAAYLIASRFLSPQSRWWALALLWSMPMFPLLMGWAYVDLALLFYELLAAYAFLRWLEDESRPWLLLSGACAGLAMGVKYTAFVLPLALLGLWAWHALRRGRFQARLVEGILFCVLALGVAAPWFLRNGWLVGNPIYPFLWGGKFWDSWLAHWYEQPGTGVGLDLASLLRLPLSITLGVDLWGGARDETFYDGRTGPLLLALLPVLLIARRIPGRANPDGACRAAELGSADPGQRVRLPQPPALPLRLRGARRISAPRPGPSLCGHGIHQHPASGG